MTTQEQIIDQYIPSHLLTPAKFCKDTTLHYCEKKAFKAHGGRYFEAMYEAPLPAALNPLLAEESAEWGDSAMKFVKKVELNQPVGRSGRVISRKTDYTPHTPYKAFFGYKSEAPTAKVFSEDEPIGPAAAALKAAGTLIAILDKHGEETEWVRTAFQHAWGVDIEPLKHYIQPDATNTSIRDLVKLTRSSKHTLYGFQAEQPAGSIDLGAYRPTTMREPVYMDYHRLSITLRFMGEYASRYNKKFQLTESFRTISIHFAPVLSEFPCLTANRLTPPIVDSMFSQPVPLSAISKIARNTIKYYTTEIAQLRLASHIGLVRVRAPEVELWSHMSLRLLQNSNTRNVIRPVVMELTSNKSADILTRANTAPSVLIKANVTAQFNMSARRALVAVLSAYMVSAVGTDQSINLIKYSDDKMLSEIGSTMSRATFISGLVSALPRNLFAACQTMLSAGSASREDAQDKIVEYFASFCNLTKIRDDISLTPSNFIVSALNQVSDLTTIVNVIAAARLDFKTVTHMTSAIKFRKLPTDDTDIIIIDAINEYMKLKVGYWVTHYTARCNQYSELIRTSREGIERERFKAKSIEYNYLVIVYKTVDFEITIDLGISYKMSAKKYNALLAQKFINFHKKRLQLAELAVFDEAALRKKLTVNTENVGVINQIIDVTMKPKIKLRALWESAKKRLNVTTASARKTINCRLLGMKYTEEDDMAEDFVAISKLEDDLVNEDFLTWLMKAEDEDVYKETPAMLSAAAQEFYPEGITEITKYLDEYIPGLEYKDAYEEEETSEETGNAQVEEDDLFAFMDEQDELANARVSTEPAINLLAELREQVDSRITQYSLAKILHTNPETVQAWPYDMTLDGYIAELERVKTIVIKHYQAHKLNEQYDNQDII